MPFTIKRGHKALFIAALLIGTLALIALFEPLGLHLWKCRFNQMTGFFCPSCGATRATKSLLHGDIAIALQYNLLWVLTLPLLAIATVIAFVRHRQNKPLPRIPTALWWGIAAVTILFFVARNLPGASYDFLRPPP